MNVSEIGVYRLLFTNTAKEDFVINILHVKRNNLLLYLYQSVES